ncbi:phage holin [Rhodococcoides kyotonense]|uniref:Holin n=1 Tax=Rhodococcoides kyotonense TaxID=398843 RepID=A0A239FLI8_9NOCA|nr:hypothetical protein [Rhodococcus kyotonensis]SNS57796.1 hypothetical protein SAMN05421642_103360 [Rhodococcus kyotonensis]
MSVLDPVRSSIPASARQRFYDVSTAVVGALVLWGAVDGATAALWTALAVNVITLLFALLYASTTLRQAFYTVVVAASGLLGAYGIASDVQLAGVIAVVAALLGTAVAGSNTPALEAVQTGPDSFEA